MSEKGWIKIFRKLKDSAIWTVDEPFSSRDAWIDLLLMATHEELEIFDGKTRVVLKPGQIKTSKASLAAHWSWTRDRVNRYIRMLKKSGMLSEICTANGTTLTIENWGVYQDVRTATRTPNNAATNATTQATTNATSNAQTRSKEDKEDKEDKNIEPPAASWGGEWQ